MSIRLSRRNAMRRITITCLSLFAVAGCALDEAEGLPGDDEIAMADGLVDQEEFDEETARLEGQSSPSTGPAVASEVSLGEKSIGNADPSVPSDDAPVAREDNVEEANLGPDAVRTYVGEGACHTPEYLSQLAFQRCYDLGWNSAGAFNFTRPCRGWWGAGFQRLWVTCFNV
jgi:hypothetical protein